MAQREIIGKIVPGHPWLRVFYTWMGKLAVTALLKISTTGLEHVPTKGPLIVVTNHITFSDPVVIMAKLPRLLVPMAKVEIFEHWLTGWVLRSGGVIPVHRGEADTSAVKLALRVLKQNGVILLAPEGTRSPDGCLQPAKGGAALLALRSRATILPVGVSGSEQSGKFWKRLKRPLVAVSFGPPFTLKSPGKRPSHKELAELTTALMYQIAAQLPPAYRGIFSDVDSYRVSEAHARLIVPLQIEPHPENKL